MVTFKSSFGVVVLGALVGAQSIGCSSSSGTPGTEAAPEGAKPTPKAAPKSSVIPVTTPVEYRGKPITAWGIEIADHGRSIVSGLGPRNNVVFQLTFQRLGDDVLVTSDHGAEKRRILKSGVVETITAAKGPSRFAAMTTLKKDVETWRSSNAFAYDCASSTAAYYAALSTQAYACFVPEPLEPEACALATIASGVAWYAMYRDCQPQNCTTDWQCTDQYGSGYSCQAGACVQSTVSTTGCHSDADCSGGFTCDVPSGICYYEGGGGGGGGGGCGYEWDSCNSDSDCCDGYCDWYSDSCGS